MAHAVAKLAVLLAVAAEAARKTVTHAAQVANETAEAEAMTGTGMPLELWTFGAPSTMAPALTAPGGGCVPGARVVTTNTFLYDKVDNVAILAGPFGFRHPTTDIYAISQRRGSWRRCPGNNPPVGLPSVVLHNRFLYLYRILAQSGEDLMHDMAAVGMNNSFNPDQNEVKQLVEARGWRLVDTAFQEPGIMSQFMQHPQTLECILTFQGSSRQEDWLDNINTVQGDYCGLPNKVHFGFKAALQKMVGASDWQRKIKPHLGKCSKLYLVGHSLGGATSTLFYACASRAPAGHPDWELIKFRKESPQRLNYK